MGKSREKPLPASPAGAAAANHAKVVVTLVLCSPRERISRRQSGRRRAGHQAGEPHQICLRERAWHKSTSAEALGGGPGRRIRRPGFHHPPTCRPIPQLARRGGLPVRHRCSPVIRTEIQRARAMDRRPEIPIEYLENKIRVAAGVSRRRPPDRAYKVLASPYGEVPDPGHARRQKPTLSGLPAGFWARR